MSLVTAQPTCFLMLDVPGLPGGRGPFWAIKGLKGLCVLQGSSKWLQGFGLLTWCIYLRQLFSFIVSVGRAPKVVRLSDQR